MTAPSILVQEPSLKISTEVPQFDVWDSSGKNLGLENVQESPSLISTITPEAGRRHNVEQQAVDTTGTSPNNMNHMLAYYNRPEIPDTPSLSSVNR